LSFREYNEIEELIYQDGVKHDYFNCSHIMENVSMPGINSENHMDHDFSHPPVYEGDSYDGANSILSHEEYQDLQETKPIFFKDYR
jgi:hypothetical protein